MTVVNYSTLAAITAACLSISAGVSSAFAATTYSITTGKVVQVGNATDTPASPYMDKDGTFYFQQSAALYGPNDNRKWDFYTGLNMDNAKWSEQLSTSKNQSNPLDSNANTTWRCNNSPTGQSATRSENTDTFSEKNYCDLTGIWIDPDTGDWYGLVHNEFTPEPFGRGLHYDSIDYAISKDQGKTWTIEDHIITSPYSTTRNDTSAFPNQTYYYGDGDPRLVVDIASGYFYIFYGSRVIDKSGSWQAPGFAEHVARAPVSQKMAPGSWQKYHNGSWSSPGVGGAESTIVSTGQSGTGYLPASKEYNPNNTGTIDEQVKNGQLPAEGSDLFIMNVSYNAYLGMYIGTPQTNGDNQPLHFYGTTDLATQKWIELGTTQDYAQQSWYRWMLDDVNATNSSIIGKTFRSYCYIECSKYSSSDVRSSSEYVHVTIDSSAPAPTIDNMKSYQIQSADGQVLNQNNDRSLSIVPASSAGSSAIWRFTSTGDGAYKITNSSSGLVLGVSSSSSATRAWGTALSLMTQSSSGVTVGQQWFAIANVSTPETSGSSTATGTYRLVNRYSGLVLSLTGSGITVPARNWTNTGTSGDTSTPAAQTISLKPVLVTGMVKNEASGRCLDVPDSSTTNGTFLDVWDCNNGANQNWSIDVDGTIKVYGNKCLDVPNSTASAGQRVEIWDCTGNANQQWTVNSDGTIKSALSSALCLDTLNKPAVNGTEVRLEDCNGDSRQRWSLVTTLLRSKVKAGADSGQ